MLPVELMSHLNLERFNRSGKVPARPFMCNRASAADAVVSCFYIGGMKRILMLVATYFVVFFI